MKTTMLTSFDGYKLCINEYSSPNPIGVVQIAHGMEEHQGRYKDFATFLTKNGFIVVSADMRGHGKTADELGFFAKKDGAKALIKDQQTVLEYIKATYGNLPVYLFAHSMGTIISRNVLKTDSSAYKKVVLSGFPCYNKATPMGIALANTICFFAGSTHKSKMLEKMCLGSFNKQITDHKTDFDWLSFNEKNVKNYIDDPLCGFGFCCSAFRDLLTLVKGMHSPKNTQNIKSSLPILLISGDADPCIGGEDGRADSLNALKQQGFKNIKLTTISHARHEILNEENKTETYNKILKFLQSK